MVNLSICFFLFPWQPRIPQTPGRHGRRIMVQQRNSEKVLDLFDTNAAGKWGWAGGEEELYIFCKHIVCIYYILYLYTYIFMCVYCSGRICTWLRIAIGLYAWDVHGPHVFQTQPASSGDDPYTPDQLYIRKPFDQCIPVQRNGEMDSWTIGVPGPAFEKW